MSDWTQEIEQILTNGAGRVICSELIADLWKSFEAIGGKNITLGVNNGDVTAHLTIGKVRYEAELCAAGTKIVQRLRPSPN